MWRFGKIFKILCVIVFLRLVTDLEIIYIEKNDSEITRNVSEGQNVFEKGTILTPPPYFVKIVTKTANKSFLWCGGTIISKNYVLTAAHCLHWSNTTTVTLFKSNNQKQNTQYTVTSTRITKHPRWQPHLLLNDIALVELPQTPDLPDLSRIDLFSNTKTTARLATVYGWEKSSKNACPRPALTKHDVIIIGNKECKEHYGSLVTKFTVCTRSGGFGNGCHGFSGSGLVSDGLLIGVMSFGTDRCDAGYPTMFTKVSRYRKWIKRNIKT